MNEQAVLPSKNFQSESSSKSQRILRRGKQLAEVFGVVSRVLFYGLLIFSFLGFFSAFLGNGSQSVLQTSDIMGEGPDVIAVFDLSGIISSSSGDSSILSVNESGISPQRVFGFFEAVKQDPMVKAVVFRVNSPGGSVTASEEIYQLIVNFKNETQLPVYASFGEVAASGGYYVSLAADQIITNPTTLTGSIGVIASTYNFKGLADSYGVKGVTVTSGDNKAFLDPLQDVDSEQVLILKEIVDEAYLQFLDQIKANRTIENSELETYADGRPLSGRQAVALGFADKAGSFHNAIKIVREDLGSPNARVVQYGYGTLIHSLLGMLVSRPHSVEVLIQNYLPHTNGAPAYLYVP